MDNAQYDTVEDRLRKALHQSEKKAWDSLARYKFQMFGYWASIWVHLNRVGGFNRPNPFTKAVELALKFSSSPVEDDD